MTNRQKAIAKAKEALRFFLTRNLHTPGFNHWSNGGYVYSADGWVVYLTVNGSLDYTLEVPEYTEPAKYGNT
jgi:hypothetical protein